MNDLVSVVIPIYNSEEYLDETIQSVIDQTYSDLEIILIDDGSTDSSGAKCDGWLEKDNRIAVLHIENVGPSRARNLGISKATGDYILPVDSDDILGAEYVEKAIDIMQKDPDMGIVYCEARLFGAKNEKWKLPQYSIREMLIANCIFATALFRRSDWKIVGGYSSDMKWGIEDYDFWLSIIALGRKVYQIPEELFYYRIHKGSRSSIYETNKDYVVQMKENIFSRHQELYLKNYYVGDRNDRVVLYGAGAAGKTYYRFLQVMGINNVTYWVDRNYKKLEREAYPIGIMSPSMLNKLEYDMIIVAINNEKIAMQIMDKVIYDELDCKGRVCWFIKEN